MTEGQYTDQTGFGGHGTAQNLWQTCIDQLAQELPEQQFSTWIKPLSAQVADDLSKVIIFVANRFKLDWIRVQYSGRIVNLLETFSGQPIPVELALAPRETNKSQQLQHAVEPISMEESTELGEEKAPNAHQHRLNRSEEHTH